MPAAVPVLVFQDPIDRIAYDFTKHCCGALHQIAAIKYVADQYETDVDAMAALVEQGLSRTSDPAHLKLLCSDAPQLERCLLNMDGIKTLARQAFAHNFADNGSDECARFHVFRQEVCFSYACKMLVSMGPPIEHFSNRPARNDVIRTELALAMNTPIFPPASTPLPPPPSSPPSSMSMDLICREAVTPQTPPPLSHAAVDLTCYESMPESLDSVSSSRRMHHHPRASAAAKQTQPTPPLRRRRSSCRRQ